MIAAELIAFTVALFALSWVRRQQMASLNHQAFYLRRFAEYVPTWRNRPGIPHGARQAIEVLVNMPLDKRMTRACARAIFREQGDPDLAENSFWLARSQLTDEQREAFDWLLDNYFLAMTYSDWLAGSFIRRARINGLSSETRAEVAIETVFASHGLTRPVAAAAA